MIQISKSEGKGSHLFCNKRLNFVLLGGILLVKYSLKARWRMLIFGKIIRSIQKTDRGTCSFSAKRNSLNRKELKQTHLEILVCIFGCLQFLINLIFFLINHYMKLLYIYVVLSSLQVLTDRIDQFIFSSS